MKYPTGLALALAIGLSACNGADTSSGGSSAQTTAAQDTQSTQDSTAPENGHDIAAPTSNSAPQVPAQDADSPPSDAPTGPKKCSSTDPNNLCLALKYVVYQEKGKNPILSETEALANVAGINSVWAQCKIEFVIDQFVPVDPTQYGLSFNTPTMGELTSVRQQFEDSSTLLVVETGQWSGSLGAGAANAWTSMPGGAPYGAVLEEPVGKYPNIIAHELGHYLSLPHANNQSQLMNPVIYDSSKQLTSSECSAARESVTSYWSKMQR